MAFQYQQKSVAAFSKWKRMKKFNRAFSTKQIIIPEEKEPTALKTKLENFQC